MINLAEKAEYGKVRGEFEAVEAYLKKTGRMSRMTANGQLWEPVPAVQPRLGSFQRQAGAQAHSVPTGRSPTPNER